MLKSAKDTFFSRKESLNCGGKLLDISSPLVMGILNITPDSFYDGGRYPNIQSQMAHIGKMLDDGASIIDLGAVSTRPGSKAVTVEEEKSRMLPLLKEIMKEFPGIVISVDTFRANIAEICVNEGAVIINDISGGSFDTDMMPLAGKLGVPYIMMHIKGTPPDMQMNPHYNDVTEEIMLFFARQIDKARQYGIADIIIDPGFGFGKKLEHNYELLKRLGDFRIFELPILAGFSRKSMINKVLGCTPSEAVNGTTVLNTIALMKGVAILRVHDVKEAVETIKITGSLK